MAVGRISGTDHSASLTEARFRNDRAPYPSSRLIRPTSRWEFVAHARADPGAVGGGVWCWARGGSPEDLPVRRVVPEVGVGSYCPDLAVVEPDDQIGAGRGGGAVGDDQAGAVVAVLGESAADLPLGRG